MDGYASTFTTIGTLLTTQTQNRTVTLNSTLHLRSSNRSDIQKLGFLFFSFVFFFFLNLSACI